MSTIEDPPGAPRRKFLWRFLQVVAVASWVPLIHLSLAFVGHMPAGWEFMKNVSFFALPPLTLFALLSFFLDRHANRVGDVVEPKGVEDSTTFMSKYFRGEPEVSRESVLKAFSLALGMSSAGAGSNRVNFDDPRGAT